MRHRGRNIMSVTVILSSSMLGGFVYAQPACPTCNQPPTELQKYYRAMDKLIAVLPAGSMDVEGDETLAQLSQGSLAAIDSALTSTLLGVVLSAQTVVDTFAETKTMFHSESRRRDRDRLVDYDWQIAQRVLIMAKSRSHDDKIDADRLAQVDDILKELGYIQLATANNGDYWMQRNGATYAELADLMWKMNQFYKALHHRRYFAPLLRNVDDEYRKTDDLDENQAIEKPRDERLGKYADSLKSLTDRIFVFCRYQTAVDEPDTCSPIEVIDFNLPNAETKMQELFVHVRQISKAYECSTGLSNVCGARKEVREDSWKLMADRGVNDLEKAKNVFLDSRKRLVALMFGPEVGDQESMQQRKEALTNSYWGPNQNRGGADRRPWQAPMFGEDGTVVATSEIEAAPQRVGGLAKTISNIRKKKDDDPIGVEQDVDSSLGPGQDLTTRPQPDSSRDLDKADSPAAMRELYQQQVMEKLWDRNRYQWNKAMIDLRSRANSDVDLQQVASFQATFKGVLELQGQLQTESVFTDTKRVTRQFPALSAAIYKNMELIGKKNSDGMLYHSIGRVCELQCENLEGVCWYPTD